MRRLSAFSLGLLCLAFAGMLSPPEAVGQASPAPDLEGSWHGTLEAGGQKLTVIFHLERGAGDALTATMDVPQQGAAGLPVSEVRATEDSLRLEVAQIGGAFEGARTGGPLEGTWQQGGRAFPLVLRPGEPAAGPAPRRPQEPQAPFPYEAEDVTYPGGAEGVTLAGTLTIPEGEGPHPAVVLISGSGPQDRNEETPGAGIGHKPFLVLADYLTRRGVAVLRYDERGIEASTGSLAGVTSEDLAADVQAGLRYLRNRADLNLGNVGLIGHSEGGTVGPMLAARTGAVDFLVLLAGPAVPGDQIIAEQVARITRARGGSATQAAENRAAQKRILAAVTEAPDSAAAASRVRAVLKKEEGADASETSVRVLTSPQYRYLLTHDPRPVLRQLDLPVLALYGTKDVQVAADQNAPAARQALADDPDATVKVLPGLNHLFQTAETGLPGEYAQIEETFAPKALETIGDWIAEHTRAGAP